MNLTTTYLGLKLRSPFIVGASPFCDSTFVARRLEDAGAGAVVMRSLFEEQLEPPARGQPIARNGGAGASEKLLELSDYQLSPDQYLRQLADLKADLTIPVIASLNGHRPGEWIEFARRLERAGADAIELNFYQVVTDPTLAADQIETAILETVHTMADSVKVPIAVKLSPFHTGVAQLAAALELAGAAGIVLFNRFFQPDVNVDEVDVQPTLRLSESSELLLRLRWLAILSPQLRISLAATGGVHRSEDAVKAFLTGAHAVQIVSVLLQHGPRVIETLVQGVERWMREHDYTELEQWRGTLNLRRCRDSAAFERANYIRALQSWTV
jgi:dihydroorotate dehydrogenase (fumarate)